MVVTFNSHAPYQLNLVILTFSLASNAYWFKSNRKKQKNQRKCKERKREWGRDRKKKLLLINGIILFINLLPKACYNAFAISERKNYAGKYALRHIKKIKKKMLKVNIKRTLVNKSTCYWDAAQYLFMQQ